MKPAVLKQVNSPVCVSLEPSNPLSLSPKKKNHLAVNALSP